MALDHNERVQGKAHRSANSDLSKALPPRPHERQQQQQYQPSPPAPPPPPPPPPPPQQQQHQQPHPTWLSQRSSIGTSSGVLSRASTAATSSDYSHISEYTHSSQYSQHSRQSQHSQHTQWSQYSASLRSDFSPPPPLLPLFHQEGQGSRLSLVSIIDDPFFLQYREEEQASGGEEADKDSLSDYSDSARDEDADRWPPPRRESLTIGHHLTSSQSSCSMASSMASLNIAVIGASGVGKSEFVQRVLDLPRPPVSNASQARRLVDGVPYLITLLELDLEHFELNPDVPIQWPRQINGHIVPRVDGALIIYDVTCKDTINELPKTLTALKKSDLPTILVANKCDIPEEDWELDSSVIANHTRFKACISNCEVSATNPESSRSCLNAILKAAAAARADSGGEPGEPGEPGMPRRRAQSAANILEIPPETGRPHNVHNKHNRASSDLSALQGFQIQPAGQTSRGPVGDEVLAPKQQPAPSTPSGMLRTPVVRHDQGPTSSFLDVDESDPESGRFSEDIPILLRTDDVLNEKPKAVGVTFDDLVDRLLGLKLSKADNNFPDIFLCLYRKFAAPGELFSAIVTRLHRVREDRLAHYLTKTATRLRMIEIVAKWVSLYPGDFARPGTRRNLEELIRHLASEPIFSLAAQQMRRNLDHNVVEDDDTGWAKSDDAVDMIMASRLLSRDAATSIPEEDLPTFDRLDRLDRLAVSGDHLDCRPSTNSDASHLDQGSQYSTHFQLGSFDDYEREAALLEPRWILPMNKMRYRTFMEISDLEIAQEITRIDWIMFSSIRTRDFVRHVSLPADEKSKCKSLKNTNRMISHFNHVAKWVSSMILLRDKAKHRALVIAKFVDIAKALRVMNNYNGLAAILAGLQSSPIHRLSQTRALVPAEAQTRLVRLGILMGTQKSHFAYRLAWENSPFPRIPFIPLHRRDLVSAEEGGKTFVGQAGERINWKKFEVLGEVLLPMMKSQATPYPELGHNEAAKELILDCQLTQDEEELYQRSVEVENPASQAESRKRFPWFAK